MRHEFEGLSDEDKLKKVERFAVKCFDGQRLTEFLYSWLLSFQNGCVYMSRIVYMFDVGNIKRQRTVSISPRSGYAAHSASTPYCAEELLIAYLT